jgi:hypothetical protein
LNDPAQFWADPRLIYTVAATAVALLLATIWLFKRRRRQGRQAGIICLIISIALHAALILLVPLMQRPNGGSSTADQQSDDETGVDVVSFSTFDPDMTAADASGESAESPIVPLPVSSLTNLVEATPLEDEVDRAGDESQEEMADSRPADVVPESLTNEPIDSADEVMSEIDSQLSDMLDDAFATDDPKPSSVTPPSDAQIAANEVVDSASSNLRPTEARPVSKAQAPNATVAGSLESDFANRTGQAKEEALLRTGGSAETEAAVEAALRFLADAQRADGAWDPRASGAGVERAPLGENRGGAGARAETAITGLALLTLMGAGQTHQAGDYADNVYRGLAYLIRHQKPNGSMAGNASVYAANYSHGMAALSMCESAAISRDPSALISAQRAIAHTRRMQHPRTGGWRYREGSPGDLSQLGWQAMVMDAGHRADIPIDQLAVAGVQRFLRSVRMGAHGGLASYRPGEAPSRTMTAEALATRLLIGEQVPAAEIAEAERYLLQQPPGVGKDNYYYWYYATLALHQLQDDAWNHWNQALKRRLLATQRSDGSWSSDTLWGGYGGTVYTTSMATLCLETYYRHAIREDSDRIANRPSQQNQPRMTR